MRRVELIPAVLAVAGLAIPLIGSAWVVWPLTTAWAGSILAFAAWRTRFRPRRQTSALVLVIVLPILLLAAWEGSWWMIPAALAQLVIDARVGTGAAPRLAV
jgi:hypothetical protein